MRASNDGDAEQFLTEWAEFIFEYGSRGPNEYEIIADSWETKPEIALALLDRIRLQHDDENPSDRHQKMAESRVETISYVRSELEKLGNDELSGQFEAALVAGNIMAFQERSKANYIRAVSYTHLTLPTILRV